MTFFGKPLGNPDAIGGLFPRREVYPVRSRAGTAALVRGSVVTLDLTASATQVVATDSNSGIPGAADNTIWNTVVDPVVAIHVGSGTNGATGPALFGVVTEQGGIATNGIGHVQFYGEVAEARVLSTGTFSNGTYGTPLTVTASNSFNATITSNQRVVAFYAEQTFTALTNAAVIRRVFLHNGSGYQGSGLTVL